MEKRINIATNETGSLVGMLATKHNIIKQSASSIIVQAGNIITNYDVFLFFDEFPQQSDELIKKYVPWMGTRRFDKLEQSLILSKLNINTPKTIGKLLSDLGDSSACNRDSVIFSLLSNLNNNLVLKIKYGARGLGQTLITKDQLYELMDQITKSDKLIIESNKISMDDASEHEKDVIIAAIKGANYIIQERIYPKEEYRYIYFYNTKPIIYKRVVPNNPEEYRANVSISDGGELISSNNMEEYDLIAKQLCDYLNVPFLSIDFYKDENDQIGIFEFQMQLGYKKIPKDTLVNSVIQGFENKYNEIIK